jgi:tetratricopeptide (TPR) repeat protein
MKKLQAFIAHSFNEERDGNVIRAFLDYFLSLKDILGLEYEHADRVEAKAISQKIRDKMEGKNLFIGIFTAKNHRIEQGNLKTYLPIINYGKKELFSKGSSDWIIQESGYALAKGMQLLFLVEGGVDVDTALQGDLEFIVFKRDNPSECFKKINEILGSLSIESMDTMSQPTRASAPEIKKSDIDEEQGSEDISETPQAIRRQKIVEAHMSLNRLILDEKDITKAKKRRDEIIEGFKSDDFFTPSYWRGLFCELKLDAGYSEALNELEKMSEEYPDDTDLLTALGRIYKKYGQYSKAAEQYLKRSEKEKTMNKKIESVGKAAECYALDKRFDDAYNIILKEYTNTGLDTNSLYELYKKLAEVAKIQENKNLFVTFAEKALEIIPTDYVMRFSLAYLYSEMSNNSNSLVHYEFLREHNPDGAKLNNLGVQYERLDLKGKSIESYNEASEKYGLTLAVANIAYRYINEGFLNVASDILKNARLKEPYHENVDSALARINEIRRSEEESLTKILKSTEPEREFRVKFAEAYALPFEVDVTGKWDSRHGEIPLNMKDKKVYGETEIKFRSFAKALATAKMGGMGIPTEDSKKSIVINGRINNRAIEFELRIKTISSPYVLHGDKEYVYKGLMCVSENAQIIKVMEWEEGKHDIEFYDMKKIN